MMHRPPAPYFLLDMGGLFLGSKPGHGEASSVFIRLEARRTSGREDGLTFCLCHDWLHVMICLLMEVLITLGT